MEKTYTALGRSSTKRSYKSMTIILGAVLITMGILNHNYLSVIVGAFLIYISFYHKIVTVDQNGVTSCYHAVFFQKTIAYKFSDFAGLVAEQGNSPEMMLSFVRNNMTSRYLFNRSDGEVIVQMALDANPDLYYKETSPGKKR